jgi:hypothetical protein
MVANTLLPLKQKAQVRRHKTVRVELSQTFKGRSRAPESGRALAEGNKRHQL